MCFSDTLVLVYKTCLTCVIFLLLEVQMVHGTLHFCFYLTSNWHLQKYSSPIYKLVTFTSITFASHTYNALSTFAACLLNKVNSFVDQF